MNFLKQLINFITVINIIKKYIGYIFWNVNKNIYNTIKMRVKFRIQVIIKSFYMQYFAAHTWFLTLKNLSTSNKYIQEREQFVLVLGFD